MLSILALSPSSRAAAPRQECIVLCEKWAKPISHTTLYIPDEHRRREQAMV